MNNYYQMRMEEMLSDGPFLPRKEILTETTGNHIYYCPICGRAVGMYNIGKWYDGERGWLDRRDSCTLGHLIDWSEAPPLSEEDGGA